MILIIVFNLFSIAPQRLLFKRNEKIIEGIGSKRKYLGGLVESVKGMKFSDNLIQKKFLDTDEGELMESIDSYPELLENKTMKVESTQDLLFRLTYETGRGLKEYGSTLGVYFLEKIISSKSIGWLDSGCGQGKAFLDYLYNLESIDILLKEMGINTFEIHGSFKKKVSVVGISLEITEEAVELIKYKAFNSFIVKEIFENIHPKVWESFSGRIDLVTDFHGVHAYTSNLSYLIWMFKRVLSPDGDIFIYGHKFDVVYIGGEEVPYLNWLEDLEVYNVVHRYIGSYTYMFHLKLGDTCKKIPYLKLIERKDMGKFPPQRFFIQTEEFTEDKILNLMLGGEFVYEDMEVTFSNHLLMSA